MIIPNYLFVIFEPNKKRQGEDLWPTSAEHSRPFVNLDRENRGQTAGNRGLDEPGDDFEFEVDQNEPGDDIDGDLIEIRYISQHISPS